VPALVAQFFRARGRVHDIGEQHGRQNAVVLCRGNGSGQKLLDRVANLVVEEEEMIGTGQLEQTRSRNVFGQKASMVHADEGVPRAMDD